MMYNVNPGYQKVHDFEIGSGTQPSSVTVKRCGLGLDGQRPTFTHRAAEPQNDSFELDSDSKNNINFENTNTRTTRSQSCQDHQPNL